MKKTLFKVSFILFPVNVFAWGTAGHKTVAAVADRFLTKTTKQSLSRYLGKESLPEASLWADDIKEKPKLWAHTFGYHFEAIEDDQTYLQSLRAKDPSEESRGGVVAAIIQSERVLQSSLTTLAEKTRAVKFLIHFIGDIHQPLHSGRPDDRGGNEIERKWNRKKTNLHAIWDSQLVQSGHSQFRKKDETISEVKYADYLVSKFASETFDLQSDNINRWVVDSMKVRPEIYYYGLDSESAYTLRFIGAVDEYIYVAGLRLAKVLTNLLNAAPESQTQFSFVKAIESIVGPLKNMIDINPKGPVSR